MFQHYYISLRGLIFANLTMKSSVYLLIVILTLFSCHGEEVGGGTYFLDNQSSYKLISRNFDREVTINSKEKMKMGSDGVIGSRPAIFASELILYRDSSGSEIVAYEQIPIDETLWMQEVIDDSRYGEIYFTLIVNDQMIKK